MSKWREWTNRHVDNAQKAFNEMMSVANMGHEVPLDEARRALENMVFCAETLDSSDTIVEAKLQLFIMSAAKLAAIKMMMRPTVSRAKDPRIRHAETLARRLEQKLEKPLKQRELALKIEEDRKEEWAELNK